MKKRKFCLFILILLMILGLTGCQSKNENIEMEKGLSEVRFLENRWVSILGKYISGEYETKNGNLDWELIREDYVILNQSVEVILIDFASLQIPSKTIAQLEKNFNDLNIFLQNNDIESFMKLVCDNYDLVANSILNDLSIDKTLKQEKILKSKMLYIGYYIAVSDKEEALYYLNDFEENYISLSKNKNYIDSNSYKINRILVEVQKLKYWLEKDDFENGKEEFFHILQDL
ncbi:MAG: hypothetical protein IJ629_05465 [Clostridia bacterium]|nr:hypothetical protein [Clostridia bacterium]